MGERKNYKTVVHSHQRPLGRTYPSRGPLPALDVSIPNVLARSPCPKTPPLCPQFLLLPALRQQLVWDLAYGCAIDALVVAPTAPLLLQRNTTFTSANPARARCADPAPVAYATRSAVKQQWKEAPSAVLNAGHTS